jgi:hypothetical protein
MKRTNRCTDGSWGILKRWREKAGICYGNETGLENLASGGRRRERRCRRFSTSPGTVILRSSFSWPLDFTDRVHTICPLNWGSLVGSWYRPRSPPLEFDTYQCIYLPTCTGSQAIHYIGRYLVPTILTLIILFSEMLKFSNIYIHYF